MKKCILLRCSLYNFVKIGKNSRYTQIGLLRRNKSAKLHCSCRCSNRAEASASKSKRTVQWIKIPQTGNVRIGDNVEIVQYCHRSCTARSTVSKRSKTRQPYSYSTQCNCGKNTEWHHSWRCRLYKIAKKSLWRQAGIAGHIEMQMTYSLGNTGLEVNTEKGFYFVLRLANNEAFKSGSY